MSSETFDDVILGGTCVFPWGEERADIGIHGGSITALGDLTRAKAAHVVHAQGLHILPGAIDTQVHFREPGFEHKEDLEAGTKGAALGGITGILEMPNTDPNTDSVHAIRDKLERAQGRAWVNYAFFGGATPKNVEELGAIEREPGCCGIKIFMGKSTGSLLIEDSEILQRVLSNVSRRCAVHAEDEGRLRERKPMVEAEGATVHLHPQWRDATTARMATERLLAIASKVRRRVHILHVTTADELPLIARHRQLATMEVTPQHLTLAAPECYERLGTFAQMNPPIRGKEHRDALWTAVQSGLVDVIGSDHAPHTKEEKSKGYPNTPSGMPGVQTLLPVMLNHVAEGRLSLLRLVDLLSAGPARVYGMLGKGRIALGNDADLSIVDLGRTHTITDAEQANKSGWTPFDGFRVRGWPVATIVGGRVVMNEGEVLGQAPGQPILFGDTVGG